MLWSARHQPSPPEVSLLEPGSVQVLGEANVGATQDSARLMWVRISASVVASTSQVCLAMSARDVLVALQPGHHVGDRLVDVVVRLGRVTRAAGARRRGAERGVATPWGRASWRSPARELRNVTTWLTSLSLRPMVRSSSASNTEGPILPRSVREQRGSPRPRAGLAVRDVPGPPTQPQERPNRQPGLRYGERRDPHAAPDWWPPGAVSPSSGWPPAVTTRPSRPGALRGHPTPSPLASATTPEPRLRRDPDAVTWRRPTGIELREQTSSIRVPEGWVAVDPAGLLPVRRAGAQRLRHHRPDRRRDAQPRRAAGGPGRLGDQDPAQGCGATPGWTT